MGSADMVTTVPLSSVIVTGKVAIAVEFVDTDEEVVCSLELEPQAVTNTAVLSRVTSRTKQRTDKNIERGSLWNTLGPAK